MDALSPSDPCQTVVVKFSSQTGKTEILNNFVGYVIDHDPGPMLVVQPNSKPMGESWSKDRLAPMIRDTPAIRVKVNDSNKRNSENTIGHKSFPGGHITVAGANSPAGLASRPIRYLLLDEIDRYESTREGDPVALAEKRQRTFWNRKTLKVSSPTFEDMGIDAAYKQCDQKYEWQLRCLHCGERQFPQFKRHFQYDDKDASTTRYVCEHCGGVHEGADEYKVKQTGEWILVENNGINSKGFFANQFASPFATWAETVDEFISAGKDPEKLQTAINTAFAECWVEPGEQLDENVLLERREVYEFEVPGGLVLTAGVDVQTDRLELEVASWAESEESWSVDYQIFEGDPSEAEVWKLLTEYVNGARYEAWNGRKYSIAGICIDSGFLAAQVVNYVKRSRRSHIWATKGAAGFQRPFVEGRDARALRLRKHSKHGYKPEILGVDEGKSILMSRLRLTKVGEGYCHFPIERDEEYFAQLTAEKLVRRLRKGFRIREWVNTRDRNEAFDLRILAHAALRLLDPDWNALARAAKPAPKTDQSPTPKRKRKRAGFVNDWR